MRAARLSFSGRDCPGDTALGLRRVPHRETQPSSCPTAPADQSPGQTHSAFKGQM